MKQKKAINVQDKNVSQINIRNSNIELLRIISMLFIILGHFIMQGGIFENYRNTNHIFPYILGFGSSISVNIFLIIGTWFMVDKDFKSERVVKLYSQVFFYTTIITTILVVSGLSIPIKDIFRGYFPFFGRALWFSSAYITLMLLTPYLKRIFNIGEKKLYQLLCLMFVFISVVSTFPDLQQNYLCNTLWFAFVYLLVGWFKLYKYNKIKVKNKWLFLISGLSIYLFLITIMYCFKENNVITTIALQYLNDIKTIPNFLCAIFISLFFLELTPHNNKIINFISKPTFGIYIIHQVPALIPTLWFGLFRVSEFYNFEYFILYLIIVVFLVYIFGAIIDYIRNKFIEPIWINTSLFNKLCILIDNFYK